MRKIMLCTLAIAFIAHTAWLLWSTHCLNAAIKALTDAGEPTTIADLQPADVPDNGYEDLKIAMALANRTSSERSRVDAMSEIDFPLLKFERLRLQDFVNNAPQAYAVVDRTTTKPSIVPRLNPSDLRFASVGTEFSEIRSTATLLNAAALLDHDQVDDVSAIIRLEEIETLARFAADHPGFIGSLVAAGIRSMQAYTITIISPDLNIGTGKDAVSPAEVRRHIKSLLDHSRLRQELIDACRAERVQHIDYLRSIDEGTWVWPPTPGSPAGSAATSWVLRYLQRPYLRANSLTALNNMTGVINVLQNQSQDWQSAVIGLTQQGKTQGPPILNIYARMLEFYPTILQVRYRVETDRSLAAIALAVRLYRVEKNAWPESLEALVPDYLPAIPPDPFLTGGFLKAKFTGTPIAWSAGTDCVDDGGDQTNKTKSVTDYWNFRDRVILLDRTPRILDPKMQQLVDLDLESPVELQSRSTIVWPDVSTFTQPDLSNIPVWDEVVRFDVHGSVDEFKKIRTRRDVMAALVMGASSEPKPTKHEKMPGAKLSGKIDMINGRWTFDLLPDGRGEIRNVITGTSVDVYPVEGEILPGTQIWQ